MDIMKYDEIMSNCLPKKVVWCLVKFENDKPEPKKKILLFLLHYGFMWKNRDLDQIIGIQVENNQKGY